MTIIPMSGRYIYVSASGDWRLDVSDGHIEILPQVGGWEYASGVNLDNLAALIVSAKAHAVDNGINWSGS
jgi:hypothetical protein